jgi:hypothetical protein
VISPARLAGLWLVAWLPVALLLWLFYFLSGELPPDDLARPLIAFGGLIPVGYAALRPVLFHPAFRPGYTDWLARTPWTPDSPLPFGPVHFVWQDVVVIALLILPAVFLGRALVLLQVAAAGYLVGLAGVLAVTKVRPFAYLMGFGLGGMAFYADQTFPYFAAVMGVYAAGLLGFRRSLELFPWKLGPTLGGRAKMPDEVGWPYNRLGPKRPANEPPRWEALALGLLAGWLQFVAVSWFEAVQDTSRDKAATLGALVLQSVVILGVIIRVLIHLPGYRPPIGLAGRLATRRLLIPGYDEVFLAPFAALLLAAALPVALEVAGVSGPARYGLTMAAVVAVLIGVGPRVREWQLTAPCRITRLPTDKGSTQPGRAQA